MNAASCTARARSGRRSTLLAAVALALAGCSGNLGPTTVPMEAPHAPVIPAPPPMEARQAEIAASSGAATAAQPVPTQPAAPPPVETGAVAEPAAVPPEADPERAALRAAAEQAGLARARAEQEAAAAKRAARFEAYHRAAAEQRIAELEAAAKRSAAHRGRGESAAPLVTPAEAAPEVGAPAESPPPAPPDVPLAPAAPVPDAALAPPAPVAPVPPPRVLPGVTASRWQPEPAATNDGADSASAALIAASDFHRLQALAKDRSVPQAASFTRFSVGDLVGIHADGIDSLRQTVRVTQQGMIELPLVGAVPAAGRTQAELVADLESRLTAYVAKPRVDVLLPGAQPSQVTVTGAVTRPGTHPLHSSRSTVLEVLAEAGGTTENAGPVVELTPAGSAPPGEGVDPILIRLTDIARVNEGQIADVYLLSGDALHVPEGGSYSVEGWVAKDGIFELTRRTTVTSAIFAAGGSQFPADLAEVEVDRTRENGQRLTSVVDVEAILDGTAPDVPLQPGDTVRVPSSILLIPPWALAKASSFLFWSITFPFWHPFSVAG